MDRNSADELGKPLLLPQESSYDDEDDFQDAIYNPTASMQRSAAAFATTASPASLLASTAAEDDATSTQQQQQQQQQRQTKNNDNASTSTTTTSYYGKVSPLSTGMLFPSARGIVDALPHPSRPCLLFADHDPLAAVAHICLLEKEVAAAAAAAAAATTSSSYSGSGGGAGELPLPTITNSPKLFTVVHVCQALGKKDDPGMRMLAKMNKHGTALELPVLLHEGNIFQEGKGGSNNTDDNGTSLTRWDSLSQCLIPNYIDEAIGKKNLLRPDDAVGLYNMNLFIQKYSQLPSLFHQLLTNPSPNHRIQLSKQLLDLLKLIDSDLRTFEGPYLCGTQFTLADITIFPIIERIVVVLSTYRSFWIPPSLTHLINWYDAASDRPSIRIATADRSAESRDAYCYERIYRNEYLVEVYECYARHEEGMFTELNDARGRPGVNVYRQVVEDEMRDGVRICERSKNCQPSSCVIM